MRHLASIAALLPLASFAVHVQVGFSCYNNEIAAAISAGTCVSHTTPWQWCTNVIGGDGCRGHFGSTVSIPHGVSLMEILRKSSGSSGTTGAALHWEDRNDPWCVRLSQGGSSSSFFVDITIDDCVKVPPFGWYISGFVNNRLEHGVFTIRGNPYSLVMNDTSRDRTVNGVLIKSGEAVSLPFPFFLKMDEIPDLKFFDLNTGEQFYPISYTVAGQSGVYYKEGAYSPMWTDDFRFSDGTLEHPATNKDQIVFADIKSGATEGKVLYSTNNMPIYAGSVNLSTNIQLVTWWDFDQDAWGSSEYPKAKINDSVVCNSHSTGHIIDYTVNTGSIRVSEITGKGTFTFTMSMTPGEGGSSSSCTMRCWDASMGDTESAYYDTPADHRAEKSAGGGVATFKVTIDFLNSTWKVEAL